MLMMFKTIKIWVDLEIVTWQKNGPILWNWWCPTSKPISPTKMNDSKDKVNPEQQKKKGQGFERIYGKRSEQPCTKLQLSTSCKDD